MPDGATKTFTMSLTGTKPINLIRTTSVYIETPELLNEAFDSRTNGQSGVLCRIPINTTPFTLLQWTNIFGTNTKLAVKQINHIRIRLLDDDRNVIDMRGFNFSITLQFNIVEAKSFIEGEYLDVAQEQK